MGKQTDDNFTKAHGNAHKNSLSLNNSLSLCQASVYFREIRPQQQEQHGTKRMMCATWHVLFSTNLNRRNMILWYHIRLTIYYILYLICWRHYKPLNIVVVVCLHYVDHKTRSACVCECDCFSSSGNYNHCRLKHLRVGWSFAFLHNNAHWNSW